MANEHMEALSRYTFLTDRDAPHLFGKLDYALKDGVHIQERTHPDYYLFLQDHQSGLAAYYQDLFGVRLRGSGDGPDRYYFLDFVEAGLRGSVVAEHRYFLSPEYVIVGFLLYKVVFNDLQIELDSVGQFQKMLREEYDDIKPLLYEKLAQVLRRKPSELDDDKLNGIVAGAMREFGKLGWILLDGDYFELLPAFRRLTDVYGDAINLFSSRQNSDQPNA